MIMYTLNNDILYHNNVYIKEAIRKDAVVPDVLCLRYVVLVYVYVCIYIYIYIRELHIYIYIYIYTYT